MEPPANVTPARSASSDIPSTRDSILQSQPTSSGEAGATENPQLPRTTVVTPCQLAGDAVGSKWSWASKCVCRSTNPGATTRPVASMTSAPDTGTRPTALIRPSVTSTSAV